MQPLLRRLLLEIAVERMLPSVAISELLYLRRCCFRVWLLSSPLLTWCGGLAVASAFLFASLAARTWRRRCRGAPVLCRCRLLAAVPCCLRALLARGVSRRRLDAAESVVVERPVRPPVAAFAVVFELLYLPLLLPGPVAVFAATYLVRWPCCRPCFCVCGGSLDLEVTVSLCPRDASVSLTPPSRYHVTTVSMPPPSCCCHRLLRCSLRMLAAAALLCSGLSHADACGAVPLRGVPVVRSMSAVLRRFPILGYGYLDAACLRLAPGRCWSLVSRSFIRVPVLLGYLGDFPACAVDIIAAEWHRVRAGYPCGGETTCVRLSFRCSYPRGSAPTPVPLPMRW